MPHLSPCDIARLVLGYLEETHCVNSFEVFLKESPFLEEFKKFYESDSEICITFGGLTLLSILQDYCQLKSSNATNTLVATARRRSLPQSLNSTHVESTPEKGCKDTGYRDKRSTSSSDLHQVRFKEPVCPKSRSCPQSPVTPGKSHVPSQTIKRSSASPDVIFCGNRGASGYDDDQPNTSVGKEVCAVQCFTNHLSSTISHKNSSPVASTSHHTPAHNDSVSTSPAIHTSQRQSYFISEIRQDSTSHNFSRDAGANDLNSPMEISCEAETVNETSEKNSLDISSSSSVQICSVESPASSCLQQQEQQEFTDTAVSVSPNRTAENTVKNSSPASFSHCQELSVAKKDCAVISTASEVSCTVAEVSCTVTTVSNSSDQNSTVCCKNVLVSSMQYSTTPENSSGPPPYTRAPATNSPRLIFSHELSLLPSLTTPVKDWKSLREDEWKSPKRKSIIPRRRLISEASPLTKATYPSPLSKNTYFEMPVLSLSAEDSSDPWNSIDDLITFPPLAEKIAENINKTKGAEQESGSSGESGRPKEVQPCSQQGADTQYDLIKDILTKTESDPVFEQFLNHLSTKWESNRDNLEPGCNQDLLFSPLNPSLESSKNLKASSASSSVTKRSEVAHPDRDNERRKEIPNQTSVNKEKLDNERCSGSVCQENIQMASQSEKEPNNQANDASSEQLPPSHKSNYKQSTVIQTKQKIKRDSDTQTDLPYTAIPKRPKEKKKVAIGSNINQPIAENPQLPLSGSDTQIRRSTRLMNKKIKKELILQSDTKNDSAEHSGEDDQKESEVIEVDLTEENAGHMDSSEVQELSSVEPPPATDIDELMKSVNVSGRKNTERLSENVANVEAGDALKESCMIQAVEETQIVYFIPSTSTDLVNINSGSSAYILLSSSGDQIDGPQTAQLHYEGGKSAIVSESEIIKNPTLAIVTENSSVIDAQVLQAAIPATSTDLSVKPSIVQNSIPIVADPQNLQFVTLSPSQLCGISSFAPNIAMPNMPMILPKTQEQYFQRSYPIIQKRKAEEPIRRRTPKRPRLAKKPNLRRPRYTTERNIFEITKYKFNEVNEFPPSTKTTETQAKKIQEPNNDSEKNVTQKEKLKSSVDKLLSMPSFISGKSTDNKRSAPLKTLLSSVRRLVVGEGQEKQSHIRALDFDGNQEESDVDDPGICEDWPKKVPSPSKKSPTKNSQRHKKTLLKSPVNAAADTIASRLTRRTPNRKLVSEETCDDMSAALNSSASVKNIKDASDKKEEPHVSLESFKVSPARRTPRKVAHISRNIVSNDYIVSKHMPRCTTSDAPTVVETQDNVLSGSRISPCETSSVSVEKVPPVSTPSDAMPSDMPAVDEHTDTVSSSTACSMLSDDAEKESCNMKVTVSADNTEKETCDMEITESADNSEKETCDMEITESANNAEEETCNMEIMVSADMPINVDSSKDSIVSADALPTVSNSTGSEVSMVDQSKEMVSIVANSAVDESETSLFCSTFTGKTYSKKNSSRKMVQNSISCTRVNNIDDVPKEISSDNARQSVSDTDECSKTALSSTAMSAGPEIDNLTTDIVSSCKTSAESAVDVLREIMSNSRTSSFTCAVRAGDETHKSHSTPFKNIASGKRNNSLDKLPQNTLAEAHMDAQEILDATRSICVTAQDGIGETFDSNSRGSNSHIIVTLSPKQASSLLKTYPKFGKQFPLSQKKSFDIGKSPAACNENTSADGETSFSVVTASTDSVLSLSPVIFRKRRTSRKLSTTSESSGDSEDSMSMNNNELENEKIGNIAPDSNALEQKGTENDENSSKSLPSKAAKGQELSGNDSDAAASSTNERKRLVRNCKSQKISGKFSYAVPSSEDDLSPSKMESPDVNQSDISISRVKKVKENPDLPAGVKFPYKWGKEQMTKYSSDISSSHTQQNGSKAKLKQKGEKSSSNNIKPIVDCIGPKNVQKPKLDCLHVTESNSPKPGRSRRKSSSPKKIIFNRKEFDNDESSDDSISCEFKLREKCPAVSQTSNRIHENQSREKSSQEIKCPTLPMPSDDDEEEGNELDQINAFIKKQLCADIPATPSCSKRPDLGSEVVVNQSHAKEPAQRKSNPETKVKAPDLTKEYVNILQTMTIDNLLELAHLDS